MKSIQGVDFRNRSSQAQEVLNRAPGLLERWILVILTCMVILLMAGAWFVRYPEAVRVRGVLLAREPVQQVTAPVAGMLQQWVVPEGGQVQGGDPLVKMGYTAPGRPDSAIILRSGNTGRFHFIRTLKPGQLVDRGALLGEVVPDDNEFYVRLLLHQTDLGKLHVGMDVKIEPDAYSWRDVGYIPGKIAYISNVIGDSGCAAYITLDRGLVTNLQKKLDGKPGMSVQGMVVLRNGRLLERMLPKIFRF